MPGHWLKTGTEINDGESEETASCTEANEVLVSSNVIEGLVAAKVVTKEGTTKAGLPGWEDFTSENVCDRR